MLARVRLQNFTHDDHAAGLLQNESLNQVPRDPGGVNIQDVITRTANGVDRAGMNKVTVPGTMHFPRAQNARVHR